MSKGNQKSRMSGGAVNWMKALMNIRPKGFKNIPQHLDRNEVLNRTNLVELAGTIIKKRKRSEQKLLNGAKFTTRRTTKKKSKADKIEGQIDRGFEIAERWGWVVKCKY